MKEGSLEPNVKNSDNITIERTTIVESFGLDDQDGLKWVFDGRNGAKIYMMFTSEMWMVVKEPQCSSQITVRDASGKRTYRCLRPPKVFHGKHIWISASKTSFQALLMTHPITPGICDFGTGNIGTEPPLIVYELSSVAPEHQFRTEAHESSRGINFENKIHMNIVSTEMISVGDKGAPLCYGPTYVLAPESDIPSCHADYGSTCRWKTNARYQTDNAVVKKTNISGGVFVLDNTTSRMSTKWPIVIDKICLTIEYLTVTTNLLKLYVRRHQSGYPTLYHSDNAEHLLTSRMLKAARRWQTETVLQDVPEEIFGRPVSIVAEINGSSAEPVFIKRIYGCNPYVREQRFKIRDNRDLVVNFKTQDLKPDSKCQNGGKLGKEGCVCPVGFTGADCETGCGRNKFGPDCSIYCSHSDNKECDSLIFCKRDLGCFCAPGWKGKFCNQRCHPFEYGAGCNETCGRCKNLPRCDPYTGICTHGCQPGYIPPFCKRMYVQLTKRPEVAALGYDWADIGVNFTSADVLSGDGRPVYYRIHYKEIGTPSVTWRTTKLGYIPGDNKLMTRVGHLSPGRKYFAKLAVYDESMNSYEGDNLPLVDFKTLCTDARLNITVIDRKSDSARLKWKVDPDEVKICRYESYEIGVLFGSKWETSTTDSDTVTINDLLPDARYTVRIGQGEYSDRFFSYISLKPYTSENNDSDKVTDLKVEETNQTSVTLSWKSVKAKELTFLIEYECLKILADDSRTCVTERGSTSAVGTTLGTVTELEPFRLYRFKVGPTSGQKGSAECRGTTKESVPPAAEDLSVVRAEEKSLEFRFRMPEIQDGFLRGIVVRLNELETPAGTCCPYTWEQQLQPREMSSQEFYNFKASGLNPGRSYVASVEGWSLEKGPTSSLEVSTRPAKPPPFPPPKVAVAAEPPLTWVTVQNYTFQADSAEEADEEHPVTSNKSSTDSFDHTEQGFLLLVLHISDDCQRNNSIKSEDLKDLLRSLVGTSFHVAKEYKISNTTITVGDGTIEEGVWSSVDNAQLTPGNSYRLAAVKVASYKDLHNINAVFSDPFVAADPTKSLEQATEDAVANTRATTTSSGL